MPRKDDSYMSEPDIVGYGVASPSKNLIASGQVQDIWGRWARQEWAREWMRMRFGDEARVVTLLSTQEWWRELGGWFPEQSKDREEKLPHVVLLFDRFASNPRGNPVSREQLALYPLFFPTENHSPAGPREISLMGIGKRHAEIVPMYERAGHPTKKARTGF